MKIQSLAALLLLLTGCKYGLAPILWVYELGHPPAVCSAPLPSDGRGYQCERVASSWCAAYCAHGEKDTACAQCTQWSCVAPSATRECDGGERSTDWWPDAGHSTVEDVTDSGAAP